MGDDKTLPISIKRSQDARKELQRSNAKTARQSADLVELVRVTMEHSHKVRAENFTLKDQLAVIKCSAELIETLLEGGMVSPTSLAKLFVELRERLDSQQREIKELKRQARQKVAKNEALLKLIEKLGQG